MLSRSFAVVINLSKSRLLAKNDVCYASRNITLIPDFG